MPGGGKKAVFPTMALHDHEKNRVTAMEQDRMKKFHQSRGRKYALHLVHSKRLPSSGQHDIQFHQSRGKSESKDSPEKERCEPIPKPKAKTPSKPEPNSK